MNGTRIRRILAPIAVPSLPAALARVFVHALPAPATPRSPARARTAGTLLLLAALLALFALPAAAQAQTEVWSETLTVHDISGTLGCQAGTTSSGCANSSVLTEDAFTYDGTSYVFKTIFLRSTGRLSIEIEPTLTGDALNLTLDVDGTTFAFQDADVMTDSNTASIRHWDSSGLSWTDGDTVALKLTAPATTLVSNLGQPTEGATRLSGTVANTFSTGSNTTGYILSSIVLDYKDAAPGSAVDLQVREMDTSNNFPEATVLYAFTRPAAFATGELTFTAPADAELDANKTYAVVMTINRLRPAARLIPGA